MSKNDVIKQVFEKVFSEKAKNEAYWCSGQYNFQKEATEIDPKINLKTPKCISVDFYESLHEFLRTNKTMVLRTGQGNFCLVYIKENTDIEKTFFLQDDICFPDTKPFHFVPKTSYSDFYPLSLLNSSQGLTEPAKLSAVLYSGLISEFLHTDDKPKPIFAISMNSTFSFEYRAYPEIKKIITHQNGQVEFDGLFTCTRDGQDCLVVIEAKDMETTKNKTTLAKHKLIYPVASVQNKTQMDIIPLYIKFFPTSSDSNGTLHTKIAECKYAYDDENKIILSSLEPKSSKNYLLHF